MTIPIFQNFNSNVYLMTLMVVCWVGSNSVLKAAVSDPKINGKRIFIFIVGGMTRSEVWSP